MQLFQKFLEIENESGYNILHLNQSVWCGFFGSGSRDRKHTEKPPDKGHAWRMKQWGNHFPKGF